MTAQTIPGATLPPIFFVHVMKTAGTTVHSLLRPHYPDDECYPGPNQTRPRKLFISRLLNLPADEKARNRYASVHMPAWVADEFAPNHLHITILREPVERTISHLRHIARAMNAGSLEEIYNIPAWRDRLANYQTRIFSTRKDLYDQSRRILVQAIANNGAESAAAVSGARSDNGHSGHPGNSSLVQTEMYCGIVDPRPRTNDDLQAATDMLDSFDVIGVSGQLEPFLARLSDAIGTTLVPVEQHKTATDKFSASDAFRERINSDNSLYLFLHKQSHSISFKE
jgi:hypothetical protein